MMHHLPDSRLRAAVRQAHDAVEQARKAMHLMADEALLEMDVGDHGRGQRIYQLAYSTGLQLEAMVMDCRWAAAMGYRTWPDAEQEVAL